MECERCQRLFRWRLIKVCKGNRIINDLAFRIQLIDKLEHGHHMQRFKLSIATSASVCSCIGSYCLSRRLWTSILVAKCSQTIDAIRIHRQPERQVQGIIVGGFDSRSLEGTRLPKRLVDIRKALSTREAGNLQQDLAARLPFLSLQEDGRLQDL